MSDHPSQYALDRAALGAPAPPDLAAHLACCASCASSVEARRAAEAPPPWLADVKIAPARRRRWPLWLVPVPALAVAVALFLAVRPPPTDDAVRSKGAPQVGVFVKRGGEVTEWDGRSPVRAGDRLRLSIRGAGYAELSVASLSGSTPAVLYAGPLAREGETVPPLSFRVDAEGAAEDLSVILSMRPIAPWEHAAPPERRGDGTWSTRLHLPKEAAP